MTFLCTEGAVVPVKEHFPVCCVRKDIKAMAGQGSV